MDVRAGAIDIPQVAVVLDIPGGCFGFLHEFFHGSFPHFIDGSYGHGT